MRTEKKITRLLLPLLLFALLLSALAPVCFAVGDEAAGPDPAFRVEAKAALLVDLGSGRDIYEQAAHERIYPASLTKIMTCLVALENGNLSDMVTVTESALSGLGADSSSAGLKVGETMSLENLLYCMMIVSGNDACNVIAEHIAGSVADYVRMMNERAYNLGCEDTHFNNTHGLHDEAHYTTAHDLSLITQAALKSENFRQIVSTAEYELPATNLSEARQLKTTNLLITKSSSNLFYYPRANGVKTGYTSAAGRCLIATAKSGDVELLAIVCGAATTILETGDLQMESFPQCIRLFDYGFDGFSYVTAASPLYPVAQMKVNYSAGSEAVALAPQKEIKLLLPNNYQQELLKTEVELSAESIDAPVSEGDVLGVIRVSYDGEALGETNLCAITDVARSEFSSKAANTGAYVQKNWWKWIVLAIFLLVAAFAGLFAWRQLQRRRMRRLRMKRRREDLAARRRRMEKQDFDGYER